MMQVPHWSRGLVPTHLQTLLHLEVHSNAPREGQESSSTVGRWSSGDRDVREIPSNHTVTFPSGSAGKESARNAGDLVQSLGWEDPLENRKAAHSSILAWRIPRTCIVHGVAKSRI